MEVFKYLHEGRVSVLSDGLIRFTQPSSFNDPFEVKPVIKELGNDPRTIYALTENYEQTLSDAYQKLTLEQKSAISFEFLLSNDELQKKLFESVTLEMNDQTPQLKSALQTHFASNIGILSLSEVPDNLLMWAHYANDHKGFTLGFDSTHQCFDQRRSDSDQLRHLRKVSYSNERPVLTFSEIKGIDEFMVKGSDWSHEREWRLTQVLVDADKVIEDEISSIHLFKIPFTAYRSVRIGARASQETKKKIYDVYDSNPELAHIEIYELSVDDTDYKLIENPTRRSG